jgi:hypothetical protein
MKTSAFLAAIVAVLLSPGLADAQQLKLEIQDGRVTLEAQNVPVRQILAEWARVGGTKIVNGEKVVGSPLTLQFQAMPERQALDIILRGVSGYMLAARQADTGVSAFDRIMILPTSAAPRNPAPAPVNTAFGNRNVPAPPTPVPAEPEEEEIVEDGEEADAEPEEDEEPGSEAEEGEPSSAPAQQGGNRFQPRRGNYFPNPMSGAQPTAFPQPGTVQAFPGQQPQQEEGEATPPTPGNPFGVPAGASTVPGVVTPVPQPTDPNAPQPNRRPPQ